MLPKVVAREGGTPPPASLLSAASLLTCRASREGRSLCSEAFKTLTSVLHSRGDTASSACKPCAHRGCRQGNRKTCMHW